MTLQRHLGHDARVSRTAVWLPLDEGTNAWRVTLIQVLERLTLYWIKEPPPEAVGETG